MAIKNIFISFLLLILFAGSAEAKWWIFGASEDEVAINYLHLNNASYDEMGPKTTVYRETLPDSMILLTGKASVKKGKIGSVRITVNNKEKWEDAKFSDRGDFEFRFRAEAGKAYVLYVEVMDTRGKTNDIEATRKEVIVSEQNIQATIKNVLDKMIEAYRNEDANRFMSYVSEDFAGDITNIDRAIRKDFSAFDNIDLRYTLNNVASSAKSMIFVSLNFNRMVISSKSGQSFTDKGTTEFVFKLGDKGPVVFSMKNPLIFGLIDAANVATGTVQSPSNEPIIVVDDQGNVDKKPFNEAMMIITGGETSTVVSGTNILLTTPGGHPPAGFNFAEGEAGVNGDFLITGHTNPQTLYGFLANGVRVQDIGMVSISSIKEAPASGYAVPLAFEPVVGHSYAFLLANGKYALMELKSMSHVPPPTITFRIDYKYQPDGSRGF